MARNIALQELQDISQVLKDENTRLEEEKEKLLFDQIDKPSDDKDIEECLRTMNAELEEKYNETRDLLIEFVETTSRQKENTPQNRVVQIAELRIKIDEVLKRIQTLKLQKINQERIAKDLNRSIQACEKEIVEKNVHLNKFKSVCVKSNKLDQSTSRY